MKNFYFFLAFLFFFFQIQNLSGQGETCQTAVAISAGLNTADGPETGNGCHNCSPGDSGGIPAENADWFTFTPTDNGVLDISTCGKGVDTRLWIYSGSCDNLTQVAASDDDCDFEPGQFFAASVENLTVTAGTTYFIEFDDAWEISGFDFEVNFTKVTDNVFIEGFEIGFTGIPENQLAGVGIPLTFTVGKQGLAVQSGVFIKSEIFEITDTSTPVSSVNSPTFDLPENPITITSGAIQNLAEGDYFLVQTVFPSGNDEVPSDNSDTSRLFKVTDRTFSVDDGIFPSGIGIRGPAEIKIGQNIQFEQPDEIHSVSFNFVGGNFGDTLRAEIYSVNSLTGSPLNLLHFSKKITLDPNDPDWIEIPFDAPFIVEDAGSEFIFVLSHQATGSEIDLSVSENIFQPRKAWIELDGDGSWIPIENTLAEKGAFAIRPNNRAPLTKITVQVDMRDEALPSGMVWTNLFLENSPQNQLAQMTDLGNNIYEATFQVPRFSNFNFLFGKGTSTNITWETVPTNCSELINNQTLRSGAVRMFNVDFPAVCFGRCGICPIQGCSDPSYILCDDFEQYDLGEITPQSLFWQVWSSDSPGGQVSDEISSTGDKSMLIDGALNPSDPQDILLLLNDVADGAYELKWNQFVPSGKAAYFSLLHQNPPTESVGHNFYFDPGGSGEIWLGNEQLSSFQYPDDQWFEIGLNIDFPNDYATLSIDGAEVAFFRFSDATDIDGNPLPSLAQLASVNFFPIDEDYRWFVDDVFYREVSEMLDGNVCFDAEDVNFILSKDTFLVRDNQTASSEFGDPSIGIDCYVDGELNNTKWFKFTGDGNRYRISAGFPVETDPLANELAAISMSIYSGSCENLTEIVCADEVFNESYLLTTENNKDYYVMIDGDKRDDNNTGLFRLEITQMVKATISLNMKNYLADGGLLGSNGPSLVYDIGDFDLVSAPFTNNGDSTYTGDFLMPANSGYSYFFSNGLIPGFEPQDSLANCRIVSSGEVDFVEPRVCWGLCTDCPDISSVTKISDTPTIRIFPNPASEEIYLEYLDENFGTTKISIFNQLGQIVFNQKLEGSILNEKIDVNNWQSGVYIISVRNEKGEYFEKIIIE